jgi:hypothetical protein
MGRAALHLLSGLAILVLGVAKASACTCGPPSDELMASLLRANHVIVFGQVTSREEVKPTDGLVILPNGEKVRRWAQVQPWLSHQVTVVDWFSGAEHPLASSDQAIVTIHTEHPYRSSCGFQLPVGMPMMIFAGVDDGRLVASFCPQNGRHENDLAGARAMIARARRLIETQASGGDPPQKHH